MAEPVSTVSFSVTTNGKEREINLGPDVLCTKTLKDAMALRLKRVMEEWQELLSMKGDLDEETYSAEAKRISQDRLYLKRNQSMDLAVEMFVDLECIPIIILNGCDDVHSLEDAKQVADGCQNVIEFIQDVMAYAEETLSAVKNSNPPENLTDSP